MADVLAFEEKQGSLQQNYINKIAEDTIKFRFLLFSEIMHPFNSKIVSLLGLTQTGDKSPYYKQIYFGNTCVSQKRYGS